MRSCLLYFSLVLNLFMYLFFKMVLLNKVVPVFQILLWRTNFDSKSYQDVLQKHGRRATPDPPPHLSDIYPRSPHLHHPQDSAVQVLNISVRLQEMRAFAMFSGFTSWVCSQIHPAVADTRSADPQVVELGQPTHNNTVRWCREWNLHNHDKLDEECSNVSPPQSLFQCSQKEQSLF